MGVRSINFCHPFLQKILLKIGYPQSLSASHLNNVMYVPLKLRFHEFSQKIKKKWHGQLPALIQNGPTKLVFMIYWFSVVRQKVDFDETTKLCKAFIWIMEDSQFCKISCEWKKVKLLILMILVCSDNCGHTTYSRNFICSVNFYCYNAF